MRSCAIVGLAIALAASFVTAQTVVVEDFESGWSGAGIVEMDPTGTSNALYLDTGEPAEIALPTGGAGVLTVDVYDMGWQAADWSNDIQGPRWGVAGTDPLSNAVTAAMVHKDWLGGDGGYCYSGDAPGYNEGTRPDDPTTNDNEANGYNGPSSGWNWFGPAWLSFPRQLEAWSTWTFTVDAAGLVTITADFTAKSKATTVGLTDAAQYFVAYGGSNSTVHPERQYYNGVYIDNITWTPAAAPPQTPGDADDDGDVDLDDFVVLKNNFGTTTGATWGMGDFDEDGDVDLDDFVILKNNFGN